MKILVLSSVYPRFDADAEVPWLRTSLRELKKNNCEAAVLAPAYKGLKNHIIDGIPVYRFRYAPSSLEFLTHDEGAPSKISRNPFLQLLAIPYIISGSIKALFLCIKLKPEIMHVHWPFPHAFMAYFAAFFCKIPVVLNFHGAELLLVKKKKWIKPILKIFIKKANLIFANSSFTAKKIKDIYNREVEISPYGTTLGVRIAKPSFQGKFTILFVGRHIERKGIEYLLKAAQTLDSGKFQVRIAGQGDLTEKLKSQAPEQVVFLGKLSKEDLEKEYQNASCFILPAIVDSKGDTEGLGVVLIEAAQYGLPIIASDVGGIPDVVIDRKTGLLIPEKNAEAIVKAIEELAEKEELREALVLGASEHIKRNFSWEGIVDRQVAVYKSLLYLPQ